MNELLAFDAVARHESLTLAASELCVTVSAISKQLSNLEAFLGQGLLEKQGRGVQLTALGRMYWQRVATSLRAVETATYEVRAGNAGAGLLTLASVPTFLTKWLIPRLPDFRREFPGITLSFSQHLGAGEAIPPGVDAAIRYGTGTWPGSRADYIAGREFVLIAAPDLLTQKPLASPGELSVHTVLHHEQAVNAWQQWAERHELSKASVTTGPRFAQYSALIQAAISGLGVGLVPRILVAEELAQGTLKVPCGMPTNIDQGHYLCYQPDRLDLPVFGAFRHWILSQGGQGVHLA